MDVAQGQDGLSSPDNSQTELTTDSQSSPATQVSEQQIANAIHELDKLEKFKFQGQEWTPKDLEKAILRQKDYSQKTASLSEERKAFEQERKFYDNLWADLEHVRKNPQLASEFVKLYPEKFHSALKQVLNESQGQMQTQNTQAPRPQIDVDLLAKVNRLESAYQEQEIAKNTEHINNTIERLSKTYTDANPEVVIARVFESYNQGVKPTDQTWEDAFKASQAQEQERFKARYGELVKKQTQANAKAKGVDSNGGTVGRAPKKFGSLKEVTEFAASSMQSRER